VPRNGWQHVSTYKSHHPNIKHPPETMVSREVPHDIFDAVFSIRGMGLWNMYAHYDVPQLCQMYINLPGVDLRVTVLFVVWKSTRVASYGKLAQSSTSSRGSVIIVIHVWKSLNISFLGLQCWFIVLPLCRSFSSNTRCGTLRGQPVSLFNVQFWYMLDPESQMTHSHHHSTDNQSTVSIHIN